MKLLDAAVDGIDAHVKFIHEQDIRATYCELHIDGETYMAHSYCHPIDPYNKAIGRKLAFDRAVCRLARDVRTKLWAAYFERMN